MVKHADHISRSSYLEIRRISSIRHLLTTKATVQLMCSFVLFSRLDYCNSLFVDINCDQLNYTGCKKFKTMQWRLFFARANVNTLDHCSKHFSGGQSKKILFSKYPSLCSLSSMVPCHHTCHHVSLYTFLALSVLLTPDWRCSFLSQFRTCPETFLFTSAYSGLL